VNARRSAADQANRTYAVGLARAFAGALIFAFPLLMTMEMWWMGFTLDRGRLLLFTVVTLVLLVGLGFFAGFRKAVELKRDILDAFVAYGVAVIVSAVVLALIGVIGPDMPTEEVAGKIAIQAIPGSIGAMMARGTLDAEDHAEEEAREQAAGFAGVLFQMLAGALFLAFAVAPTEEMVLIAYQMTPWHAATLMFFSILVLHAVVFIAGFGGEDRWPPGKGAVATFLHYTMAGYGIALLVSAYVLWTFGRLAAMPLDEMAMVIVVLAFPAALGAAAARLII
jgi:putative integral membrane protein (TIGR02587 family)